MWNVQLKFGPLSVWRTNEKKITSFVLTALRRQLIRIVLSRRLPEPAKEWANVKLSELDRLTDWEAENAIQN